MKIILCGYHWAGCKALNLLLSKGYEVFVFTHDNPYYVNDLIQYCKKKKVGFSTQKISVTNLPFTPDIICSIYYRYIIDDSIIKLVSGKIFNLHPSLLPKYKGCSSLNWAMINGETTVGFTYHYLTKDIDGGNILLQQEVTLEEFDTGQSIYFKVMFEALKCFNSVLEKVDSGFQGEKQPVGGEYFKRGAPHNCTIDPKWSNEKIERFIRAMIFPPMTPAQYLDRPIRNIDDYFELNK